MFIKNPKEHAYVSVVGSLGTVGVASKRFLAVLFAQGCKFAFEIDNEYLARIYNAAWRKSNGSSTLLLSVSFESRQAVDVAYAKLVAAGYESRQSPYDAFWGSRFAIVADPEGNDVGLMSPAEERFKTWPPTESPSTR